jgi:hypothetical protein
MSICCHKSITNNDTDITKMQQNKQRDNFISGESNLHSVEQWLRKVAC